MHRFTSSFFPKSTKLNNVFSFSICRFNCGFHPYRAIPVRTRNPIYCTQGSCVSVFLLDFSNIHYNVHQNVTLIFTSQGIFDFSVKQCMFFLYFSNLLSGVRYFLHSGEGVLQYQKLNMTDISLPLSTGY